MLALLEDSQVAAGPYALAGVFYDREEGPVDENGLEGGSRLRPVAPRC